MTKTQKIQEIAELEKIIASSEKIRAWKIYNRAVDRIGELNRSMRK